VRQDFNHISENKPADGDPGMPQEQAIGGFADEDPFGRFVQFLKKRLWVVALALVMGWSIGVAANHFIPKLYTAQADIEVAEDKSSEFRLEPTQELTGDEDTAEKLDTEIEILRSRDLALETIRSLHLESNPGFLPLHGGQPWNLSDPEVREMMTGNFIGGLNISRLGHTSIIKISVTSPRPELASLIANTLIDRYIEHSFRENFSATEKVSVWLESKLDGLKANLEKSQTRILDLQKDLGVYGIDQTHSVVTASLEDLNKEYAEAEVDRLLKESRLEEVKSATPDVIDAALGPLDPGLTATKQRLAQLNLDYGNLVQTYGPAYPRVMTLKAQIEQLQREQSQEEKAQIARSEKDLEASRNNEAKLHSALAQEEKDAFGKGEKAMEYELARQDYETNRLLYDGLQQRLQEASIMSGLHSTAIHIVDSADTPVYPSRPRTSFNRGVGAGIGFLSGLCLAILLEALDTNLKTMSEIEQAFQLPLLAAIPAVDAEHLLPSKFREYATSRGSSSWSKIAESLRGLRTAILLSSPGSPPKVIMIASTRPAEGKSCVAGLTAITFALNGSRVLLIDADLRRPAIHLRFRMGKGLGLTSVLSGKATFQEAVVPWPELPNLHILPSGPVPPLPSELLSSKQMEDLLTRIRGEYDFILIDTPPVLAVTDAAILGRLSDASILIIRYGAAQRKVVRRCIDLLDRSGTHLLGVAVNVVDFTAPEYSEYYGRKYYEYYGERNPE
jgi:capsular exopolysaccharide synthesis family protein